ncbi:MAG: protein-methionine-sulfoxide reductase heme-binding subunit MsrQ [Xanthobacteraceae bacterium]
MAQLSAQWRARLRAVPPLKIFVFVVLLMPALLQAGMLAFGPPQAEPIKDTIHMLGDWAVYCLVASLAITPLRQILAWPRLIAVRRMIGVAAFFYALAHVIGFAADKSFDLSVVLSEIALRTYLTIGAAGLILLAILAATSTNAMVRRLGGKRWQSLHRIVYLAAAIAAVHYFLQAKGDLWAPTLVAGVAGWLLLYRLILWSKGSAVASRPLSVLVISAIAALGTAIGESLYLAHKFGAPFDAMIAMQLAIAPPGPRPALIIAAMGLALVALAIWRQGFFRPAARDRSDSGWHVVRRSEA